MPVHAASFAEVLFLRARPPCVPAGGPHQRQTRGLRGRGDDQADLPVPDDRLQNIVGGFTHASDFIGILSNAKGRMRFHLQVAAGNQFLVLSGLYPEFLRRRSETGERPIWSSTNPSPNKPSAARRTSDWRPVPRRAICSARSRRRCPPPAARSTGWRSTYYRGDDANGS